MVTVAAFYRFTPLATPGAWQAPLLDSCAANGVTGTILLAPEGVNGTIAGPRDGVLAVIEALRALPGCAGLEWKESTATDPPFGRMKVRLKREIVTMGVPSVDPRAATGHRVAPKDWNALIADPGVAVIDTRNAYEVAIGSFAGAEDPGTASFGDFPGWWRANADRLAGKRVAMFCTGGIRCEKSTNFLLGEGVEEVYHLDGGILKYLEEVPEPESLWRGDCFVFDRRVSVGHGLCEGPHLLCHGCRRPLHPDDTARPEYEPGVACHHCVDETSEADKARFRERQRQACRAAGRRTG